MKNKLFCLILMVFSTSTIFSQVNTKILEGVVTFITSKNAYVKFASTADINAGDTLQINKNGIQSPCLIVSQKSSISCVCTIMNGCEIIKNDKITFQYSPIIEEKKEEISIEELINISQEQNPIQSSIQEEQPLYKQRIRGRLSAATYSNFSDTGEERHRMMYRFSMNANHINNSKLSVETYLNYRQNFIQAAELNGQQTKFFRVYNLALRYDIDTSLSIVLGRKINNKASSLGAIDGIQAEKFIGKNYVGLIAGFKPDIYEYDINTNLLQYGAYFGRKTNAKNLYSQTTLGLLEQRNTGVIDRRYAYFQHSSTIYRNLNIFASLELDVFNKLNEVVSNNPRLTNLYVTTRYKFSRKLNVGISYDSRRRILYYETLRTEIEQLLADDEARQGLRFNVNIRPIKYLTVGGSYSKRFQSSQQNKSDNINGYASWSKIPSIGGRVAVNFNLNTSTYSTSRAISVRHSRTLIKQKLNADFYYRNYHTSYDHSLLKTNINYYGTGLSYRINRQLRLSVLGELATKPIDNNYRVNFKIIKRFDKK